MAKAIQPTVSVVTASYDGSIQTLTEMLKRVRSQNYPQHKVEIILGHGGKPIKQLAKAFNARVIYVDPKLQNAEYNRGLAFNQARNDLVLILDHDNFMPNHNYLSELVQPLIENPDVVASESCYFHYDKNYSLLDRYYALIGTLDPIPYYLGKADRMSQISRKWNLLGKAEDKGDYYLVKFEKNPIKIPTIGTNGCLMRRNLVKDNADVRPGHHYPIDVMVDVILTGHTKFAFVKNSLIHLTGSRGVVEFLKRRLKFVEQYHFADNSKRRYSVVMRGDEIRLIGYIIASLTIVIPIWDSLRGYSKIHDVAWFLHPIMCIGIVIVYGWGTVKRLVYEYTHS